MLLSSPAAGIGVRGSSPSNETSLQIHVLWTSSNMHTEEQRLFPHRASVGQRQKLKLGGQASRVYESFRGTLLNVRITLVAIPGRRNSQSERTDCEFLQEKAVMKLKLPWPYWWVRSHDELECSLISQVGCKRIWNGRERAVAELNRRTNVIMNHQWRGDVGISEMVSTPSEPATQLRWGSARGIPVSRKHVWDLTRVDWTGLQLCLLIPYASRVPYTWQWTPARVTLWRQANFERPAQAAAREPQQRYRRALCRLTVYVAPI